MYTYLFMKTRKHDEEEAGNSMQCYENNLFTYYLLLGKHTAQVVYRHLHMAEKR